MFRRNIPSRLLASAISLMARLGLPSEMAGSFVRGQPAKKNAKVLRHNKYRPHQGAREVRRRAEQIQRGMLQTN